MFLDDKPETFEFFLCSLRVARTNLAEALQLVAPDQTRHYEFRRTRNVQEHGGTLFCSLNCNGQTSATRLFMCFAELMKARMASKQDIKKTGLPLNLDGTTRPSRQSCGRGKAATRGPDNSLFQAIRLLRNARAHWYKEQAGELVRRFMHAFPSLVADVKATLAKVPGSRLLLRVQSLPASQQRPKRQSCCCYNGFTRSTRRENNGFYKVLQGSTAFYNLLQPSWTN